MATSTGQHFILAFGTVWVLFSHEDIVGVRVNENWMEGMALQI